MRNLPPKTSRKRFNEIVNNPNLTLCLHLKRALEANSAMLGRFFANIEHLRLLKGESCYTMLKNIEKLSDGFVINKSYYSMLRNRKTNICGFYILAMLSAYFERDMFELMSKDIRPVGEAKAA